MGIGAALSTFFIASGGGLTLAGSLTLFAVSSVASTLLTKALAPGGPGVGARNITSRGTANPQAIVYGEAVVAGTLAYRNVHGNNNSELWAVHCLAGHECSDITDIYLDDDLITDSQINGGAAGGGGVTSGTYAPARTGGVNTVEVWKHLGTSTQTVDTNLTTADTNNDWTSSHRLRGIAYITTMFKLNDRTEAVWEAGDPTNVRAKVRGKIVYDPRLDTSPGANPDNATYYAWTDNPALCVADYLRDSKFSPLAGGVAATRIDWDAVEAAADDCDTLVFVPPAASPQNTEKRFTCNGLIYGTASPDENLRSLLSSMNGTLDFVEGTYAIRAGVYESPADTLSEDDMIGPVGVKTSLDSDQRVNTMKAAYINPDKLYQPDETAPITFSAYKDTRDGGDELFQSIQLPMTNSNTMAQRIVLKRLQEADQELTITVPCNLRAARLVPGERVSVTVTERGWSPKVFKVIDWEFFDRGGDQVGVNVTLREDDSAAYADPDVADYNTYSDGVLTKATPTPIPSVDTIPRGIRYGEGTWSIEPTVNSRLGASNDGEIDFSQGRFILPDGTIRTLASLSTVFTPYEATLVPPDGRFYVIWGATNPVTRFAASPQYSFGDAAGLFTAIYDRFNEQWHAVDNSNNEIAFTPADTDYVVATGTKTSASGGIDSLTALVSFEDNPPFTNWMPTPWASLENVRMTGGGTSTLYDIDSTRAYFGTQSLRFTNTNYSGSFAGFVFRPVGSVVQNVRIPEGRRWAFQCAIYTEGANTTDAASSWNIQMAFLERSPILVLTGTAITGDELTGSSWNIVRFILDATGETGVTANIQIRFNNAITSPLGDFEFNVDECALFDVTDYPEIVGGVL